MRKPKLRVFHDGKMDVASEMAIGTPEGMGIPKDLVVMISTSVLDIDGKEIYEGDICERMCGDKTCEDKHVGIVQYDTEDGAYMLYNPKKKIGWPMVANKLAADERHVVGHVKPKILGNPYENPELYQLL